MIVKSLIKKDEYAQFVLAEKISERIYPQYKFSEFGRLYLYDKEFLKYYERFEGTKNYHSLDRKYVLNQIMKLTYNVDGDTAECGAFAGASSFLMCNHLLSTHKKHCIFDSFEGLSNPSGEDGEYWHQGDLSSSEEIIRLNLRNFNNVEIYKGWIPERFSEVSSRKFSFVHLDVDLFQPTFDSLEFFYPRMNQGGIILCDDYGFTTCPGAKKAVDEFFSDKKEPVICLPTGQAFMVRR